MVTQIITIYCICDDFLKGQYYHDAPNTHMSTAEVMTTMLVAARFFGANLEHARVFLQEHHYIPRMLSKSRLNRRLHALPSSLWMSLFGQLAEGFKATAPQEPYLIDSFPVPIIDNIRIKRTKLFRAPGFRGYNASKRRYLYGLKVHLLSTSQGKPVEFLLTPAAMHDLKAMKHFDLDLPVGTQIYADKAYTHGAWAEYLALHADIELLAQPKKSMKRQETPAQAYLRGRARKRIESAFSTLTALFPRHLHAVTEDGIVLKVIALVLAFAISCVN
jgi:hypothetical protein